MAYRPRSAKTAYGSGIRNIRLPYIYDIPNAHQPAPHVAGGRYGSNHPHLIESDDDSEDDGESDDD